MYQSMDYLVELRTKELEAERDRSDSLLLNILPREVVDELHANGVVQPRRFDSASVMFTDFCSFTRIAETMTPEELLGQLEEFYGAFDEISSRHGLERLKTIGDAYMCVVGAFLRPARPMLLSPFMRHWKLPTTSCMRKPNSGPAAPWFGVFASASTAVRWWPAWSAGSVLLTTFGVTR